MTPILLPTIIALKTAVPALAVPQMEIFREFFSNWYRDVPNAQKIFEQSKVFKRHFAWDPRVELCNSSPGTGDRMKAYARLALDLSAQSLGFLEDMEQLERIGSFVMASCTGYSGPTPDLLLAKRFGLRSSLRRTFVGHMGCYAAFNVLKLGLDSLSARPQESVLLNCTELSSLQFRPVPTAEQAVIHALFGDASASLVLSNEPEGKGVQILRTHTEQVYDTSDLMTWDIENDGFRMMLSPFVPFVLDEKVIPFLEKLLGPEGLAIKDVTHWGIHPGGPKIVELLAKRLSLSTEQQRASFHVLGQYGNCSSTTVLMVLDEIIRNDRPKPGEYGVIMAFGPGLTMEGALIRF